MSVHEFTGRTTEEAINEGLSQLGVTISDVKVEVLEEGAKGLFGLFGSKQARVRMTLGEESRGAEMDDLLHSLSLDPEQKKSRKGKEEKAAAASEPARAQPAPCEEKSRPEPQSKGAEEAPRQEKPARKKPPKKESKPLYSEEGPQERRERAPRPVPPAPVDLPEVEMHDPATPLGQAQQFLIQMTRLMNVPVAVEARQDEEGNLLIAMTGDTLGILIGRRGETLDALQYLASLHVNKGREGYIRVTLDTENYRAKRAEALERLAARMAARAVKTGRRVALEPMNPYERRILHSALQGHPQVTTLSEGEEPNRHVVILLKEKQD